MWVPSSAGSLHRAHWQLKRYGFKIRVVIDVTIVMLGVFLLEEPVLGDISSSAEVANGRRDVPWVETWIIWFVTWRCDKTSHWNKYSSNAPCAIEPCLVVIRTNVLVNMWEFDWALHFGSMANSYRSHLLCHYAYYGYCDIWRFGNL